MDLTNQNLVQKPVVQQNCQTNNCNTSCASTNPVVNYPQTSIPPQYYYPQANQPAVPVQPQQPQNIQIPPSTSGVTIQIFNPSVTAPGAAPPTYNVNAPCYPSNYYTDRIAGNVNYPTSVISNPPDANAANQSNGANQQANVNQSDNGTNRTDISDTSRTTVEEVKKDESKKTEKRKIVQLTDDYIRNLERYLDSQDKSLRLAGAKDVYARLKEDDSRKDDIALTALVNKMLQDPYEPVRVLAFSALQERICTGDEYTKNVLTQMQSDKSHYGMDAVDAGRILLQMSAKQVEKEFPVDETAKQKTTKSTDENKRTTS